MKSFRTVSCGLFLVAAMGLQCFTRSALLLIPFVVFFQNHVFSRLKPCYTMIRNFMLHRLRHETTNNLTNPILSSSHGTDISMKDNYYFLRLKSTGALCRRIKVVNNFSLMGTLLWNMNENVFVNKVATYGFSEYYPSIKI